MYYLKRHRFFSLSLLIYLVLTLFLGCQGKVADSRLKVSRWMEKNGRLKVLSSTAMIDNLVQEIGGEFIDSLALIGPGLDPHSYQLVKGDDEKLFFADVIFYNGLNLEHGPSLKHYLDESDKAVGLGDQLYQSEPSLLLTAEGQVDPHIWMDVSLWQKTIPFIVKALSAKDPSHRDLYLKRGANLSAELNQLHGQIHSQLQQIPADRRYLVTSHDAFNYFARAYLAQEEERQNNRWSDRFQAPEGLAPESQLSAHDIQRILTHLLHYNITVLFPESNISRDSIQKIQDAAKKKGVILTLADQPLYGDSMGEPGSLGDTYQKMMQHNCHTIATYLQMKDCCCKK